MSFTVPDSIGWNAWTLSGVDIYNDCLCLSVVNTYAVGWWKFNNSCTAEYGNNMQPVGSVEYHAAKFNNGLVSNGTAYTRCMNTSFLNVLTDSGSIDFWVIGGTGGADFYHTGGFLSLIEYSSSHVTLGCINMSNRHYFIIGDNALGGGYDRVLAWCAAPALAEGEARHFQYIWDKSKNIKARIIIDGIDQSVNVINNKRWSNTIFASPLIIGVGWDNYNNGSNVIIDNVRFCNTTKPLAAIERNREIPPGSYAFGEARLIFGLKGRRQLRVIKHSSIEPDDTSITVQTRTAAVMPTGNGITFDNTEGFPNTCYSEWGSTQPRNYCLQHNNQSVRESAAVEPYIELKISLMTNPEYNETPVISALEIITENNSVQSDRVIMYSIIYDGEEISGKSSKNRLLDISSFMYTKRLGSLSLPSANKITITMQNDDGYFSLRSTTSPFTRAPWKNKSIMIYHQQNGIVYRGVVTDIDINHSNKTVDIVCGSQFDAYLSKMCTYTAAGIYNNPVDVFTGILSHVGAPLSDIDSFTFARTAAAFAKNNMRIGFSLKHSNEQRVQDAFSLLCKMTNSNIFINECDRICYEHMQPVCSGDLYELVFNEKTSAANDNFISPPEIIEGRTTLINQVYTVYAGAGSYTADTVYGVFSRRQYDVHELTLNGNTPLFKYGTSAAAAYIRKNYIQLYGDYVVHWRFRLTERGGSRFQLNRPFLLSYASNGLYRTPVLPMKITHNIFEHWIDIEVMELKGI